MPYSSLTLYCLIIATHYAVVYKIAWRFYAASYACMKMMIELRTIAIDDPCVCQYAVTRAVCTKAVERIDVLFAVKRVRGDVIRCGLRQITLATCFQ